MSIICFEKKDLINASGGKTKNEKVKKNNIKVTITKTSDSSNQKIKKMYKQKSRKIKTNQTGPKVLKTSDSIASDSIDLNIIHKKEPNREKIQQHEKNKEKDSKKFKRFEFELGGSVGMLNYSMDTSVHSLLKWRDSGLTGALGKISFLFNERNKIYFLAEGYSLSGGEMTDDDLNNMYHPLNTNHDTASSVTKGMNGNGSKLELGYQNMIASSNNNEFWIIGGFSARRYNLDPYGVRGVSVFTNDQGNIQYETAFDSSNQEIQNTRARYYGFVLGGEFVKHQANGDKFTLQLKAFLPTFYESKQYNWGYGSPDYDWRTDSTGTGKSYGIDFKVENRFHLKNDLYLNLYAFYSFVQIAHANEFKYSANGDINIGDAVGSSLSSKLQIVGIGTSIIFWWIVSAQPHFII